MTKVDIVEVRNGWQIRIWYPHDSWLSPFVEELKTGAVITAMKELQDREIDTFKIRVIDQPTTSKEN